MGKKEGHTMRRKEGRETLGRKAEKGYEHALRWESKQTMGRKEGSENWEGRKIK